MVNTAGLNHDTLSSAAGPEPGGTKQAQNESVWGGESLWATGERLHSVAGESIESDLPILLLSRTVEVKKRFGVQTGGKMLYNFIHTSKQGVKNTSRFQTGTWIASFFLLTCFHLISLSPKALWHSLVSAAPLKKIWGRPRMAGSNNSSIVLLS